MSKHPHPFVYTYTRSGFSQVHYKRKRVNPDGSRRYDHFCAQEAGRGKFRWVGCSSDGEPDMGLNVNWNDVPFPPKTATTSTDIEFTEFLETQKTTNARL